MRPGGGRRRGRSGGDGSDAVASGGRASPVMGSDAARSRQGPRHRHRRGLGLGLVGGVRVDVVGLVVDGLVAGVVVRLVVDPVADVRPRLIDRTGHPGGAERAPGRALGIRRRLVAHPAPSMSQDHAHDPDRDERQRDDLRGRDAEERPVVRAQRFEREARDAVPDEEREQQVTGSQPRPQPVPEEHEERRRRAAPRSTRTGTAGGTAWSRDSTSQA